LNANYVQSYKTPMLDQKMLRAYCGKSDFNTVTWMRREVIVYPVAIYKRKKDN